MGGGVALFAISIVIFVILVILFIAFIAVIAINANQVFKVSEAIFAYPGIATNRFTNIAINTWVKVRYKGGSKEGDLPSQAEIRAIVDRFVPTKNAEAPEGTNLAILAQLVGNAVRDDESTVGAASVQLQTVEAEPQNAIYTVGSIVPLNIS